MRTFRLSPYALTTLCLLALSPVQAQAQQSEVLRFGLTQRILAPSLPYNRPFYGQSIAVSEELLAVGMPGTLQGGVHIFERTSSGRWAYAQLLAPTDGIKDNGAQFGQEIVRCADQLIIAAPKHKAGSASFGLGEVYAYTKAQGGDWTLAHKLERPTDGAEVEGFGRSLACLQDKLVVGSAASMNMQGLKEGAVHIYTLDAQQRWSHSDRKTSPAPSANAGYGAKIVVRDGLMLISEPDAGGGAVHVYTSDGSAHPLTPTIKLNGSSKLGAAIAVSDSHIFITESPEGAPGKLHVFTHSGDQQEIALVQSLTASAGSVGDMFGQTLAAEDGWLAASLSQNESSVSLWRLGADGRFEELQQLAQQSGIPEGLAVGQTPNKAQFGAAMAWSKGKLIIGSPLSSFSGEVFEYELSRWRTQRLLAPQSSDGLVGKALSLHEQTVALSSPNQDSGGRTDTGGGYVLTQAPTTMSGFGSPATLTSSDFKNAGHTGHAIAHDETTLAISAPSILGASGEVYLFTKDAQQGWSYRGKLGPEPGDFGAALMLHEGRLLVGAPGADNQEGRVWIYDLSGEPRLLGSIAAAGGSRFGSAMAQDAKKIAIGAPSLPNSASKGAVMILSWDGTAYRSPLIVSADSNEGAFGAAVALEGMTLLVGAPGHPVGDPFGPTLAGCQGMGYAYSYDLGQANPKQSERRLALPSNKEATCFGGDVALQAGRAFIGASNQDDQGQVTIFTQDNGLWSPAATALSSAAAEPLRFGHALEVDEQRLFISAPTEQRGALYTYSIPGEIDAPASSSVLANPVVTFSGTSAPKTTVTITLATGPNQGQRVTTLSDGAGRWSTQTTLRDGEHQLQVSFEHISGLVGLPIQQSFKLNSTLPVEPTIFTPSRYANTSTPLFSGEVDSNAAAVELRLDDIGGQTLFEVRLTPDAAHKWSYTHTGALLEGDYTLSAQAINEAELRGPKLERALTIDVTAPAAPTIEVIDLAQNPPLFAGRAAPNMKLMLDLNLGERQAQINVPASGQWSIVWSDMLDPTQAHRLEAYSQDEASNSSTHTISVFAYPDVEIRDYPTSSPLLNGQLEDVALGTLHITLTKDDDAEFKREYEASTDDQGKWSYQIEEALAPGIYTVLIEYVGTDQFELYKLRIPYIPGEFSRSYCAASAPVDGQPKRAWPWLLVVAGLVLRRRVKRRSA